MLCYALHPYLSLRHAGYSYVYALALIPAGLLADRMQRPMLLSLGAAVWSALSLAASQATSFESAACVNLISLSVCSFVSLSVSCLCLSFICLNPGQYLQPQPPPTATNSPA